ncbi:hypothetical protein [Planktothrix agardhii]|nr:hypothetical protein [Planktothrix agardhii]MDS1345346.1 hypothetical protein [Planktothrix agardhii NRERC-751]MEA5562405.1 hypothetical protein [Planktothrix agardhii UHCC 0887]
MAFIDCGILKMISFEKIKESYPTLIDENVKSLSINFSVLAMR